MRALTAAELEVINNSTKVLDKTVLLGDYLQSVNLTQALQMPLGLSVLHVTPHPQQQP